MKKIAALLPIIVLAIFAQQARALEVQYPQLPFGSLTQNTVTLPEMFQFMFGLALWGAGILLFGGIFYAGFSYITSGASPDKRKKSLRRFGGVLMGAVILFGSFLVLQAINPELTEPKNLSFGFCNGPNSSPKDPSLPDCPDIPFFSIGGSSACGNGKIDGAEQCDGSNLNGKTCTTLGYSGGTLSCTPGCTFNTSLCVGHLSPPAGSFTYFCQGDSQWMNHPYPTGWTIGNNGCGPTSLAMIMSTFKANGGYTPPVVADMVVNGQIAGMAPAGGNGTSMNGSLDLGSLGLTTHPISINGGHPDITQMTNVFSQHPGVLIIAGSQAFPCNNIAGHPLGYTAPCSHIFVVDGVTSAGIVDVRDPANCAYAASGSTEADGSRSLSSGDPYSSSSIDSWVFAYAIYP